MKQGVPISERAKSIVRERYGKDPVDQVAQAAGLTVPQVWGVASRAGMGRVKPHKHQAENGGKGRPIAHRPHFDHRPLQEALTHITATHHDPLADAQ